MNNLKSELIDITSKLVSFDTSNPPGNEVLCLKYIKKLFAELSMPSKVYSKENQRSNIVGFTGKGNKSILIACHMDTVLAGKGWSTNPFKAVIKAGKIFGRGTTDDKGPFAISYCAVKEFVGRNSDFDGKIYLAALADEEADNIYGVKFLLRKKFKADAALVPDGGYFTQLDYGEKGCLQIKIESFGKQEHSALQENGNNAIENLIELVSTIKKNLKFENYDKRFSPLTINTSLIRGGEIANTIPAHAWIQMDIRYPLGVKSSTILNTIQKTISQTKGKFKIEIVYITEPHVVEDQKLIDSFIKSGKDLGIKIKPITIAGNSIAKELTQSGIPSITHHPMNKINAHEPNEYIEIRQMEKTVGLYVKFLENYFDL